MVSNGRLSESDFHSELIYKLKRGGKNPPRPDLSSDADSEVNSSMVG